MSTKKLLFLTVLFLGLFSFVYFFERHQPTSAEVAKARRNLVDFDPEEVIGLAIERTDLPTLAITKNASKKWLLSGDKAGPGDNGAIEALVSDLKRLEVLGEVQTEFDPKEYGLDAPRVKATLTFREGRKIVISFGREIPGTDATAAAVLNAASAGPAATVSAAAQGAAARFGAVKVAPIAALTKPVDDYRSRFLVDVPASEITRMTVVKGTTKVVLTREPAKDAPGPWKLEVPVVDAAKQQFVEALLSDFTGSRISEFPTVTNAELPRIGLSPANAVVTLEKGSEVVAQVAFGSSKADATGKVFARSGNVVVLVEDRVQEALNKELSAFRETRLLPMDAWMAVRVSFEADGQRIGAEKLDGVWRSAGAEVPAAGPDDLVERLTRVESKAFVPRKEYPSFGVVLGKGKSLPPPVATMEVTKEKETAPRGVTFYGAKGADGTPMLLAEVSGRTDGLLVERALLDDLKRLADKLRRSGKTPVGRAKDTEDTKDSRTPGSAPISATPQPAPK